MCFSLREGTYADAVNSHTRITTGFVRTQCTQTEGGGQSETFTRNTNAIVASVPLAQNNGS